MHGMAGQNMTFNGTDALAVNVTGKLLAIIK